MIEELFYALGIPIIIFILAGVFFVYYEIKRLNK